MTKKTKHKPYQPWIEHYPDDIDYFAEIDTTPVPARIEKAVKENASRVAMDFFWAPKQPMLNSVIRSTGWQVRCKKNLA